MSQINTTFEYNGFSKEFDIADVECSEKLEKALDALGKAEKEMPKTGKLSAIYKAQCGMIRDFFDNVFGKGTGVKFCGEKLHVTNHYDAYKAFLDFAKPQRAAILDYGNVFSQYSNRQQRRQAAKAKK